MGPFVFSYCQLLSTVEGRGYWLTFVGLLASSLLSKGAWQNSLTFAAGIASIVIGLLTIITGKITAEKLRKFKETLASEEKLKSAFEEADVDKNGTLDEGELAELCQKLGSAMNANQLEQTLRTLDKDNNGTISYEEFAEWFRGGRKSDGDNDNASTTPFEEIKRHQQKVSE